MIKRPTYIPLELDFDGTEAQKLRSHQLMHFVDHADDLFLLGSFHYSRRKDQISWIEGKTSSDHKKRYNIHVSQAHNEQPDFVIIYEAGTRGYTIRRIYPVLRQSVKSEEQMLKLNYPSPRGTYVIYELGDEVQFEEYNIASILKLKQQEFGEQWRNNMPIFLIGKQIFTMYRKLNKKRKFRFIDLFAGAGGLSEGFVRAGFQPIAHIEMNNYACDTLRTRAAFHYLDEHDQLDIYENYLRTKREKDSGSALWNQVPKEVINSVIEATIGEKTIDDIFSKVDELTNGEHVDLIIGGPPCQAYSIAGRARMGDKVLEDPRNELYKYYVQFLQRYNPEMFVFENVPGIQTAKKGKPFEDLKKVVDEAGYDMDWHIQLASEHGVLQNRKRMIIVGWRKDTHLRYPELKAEVMNYAVRRDVLADLPVRKAGEGHLCAPIVYTKPEEEMQYLVENGLRGKLPFTTQHIARPNNINDREIYKMAVEWWQKGKRLKYTDIPADHQKHKNKQTFLNRFQVVDPNGCCHTLVAHIAMDGHYYIYPTENPTVENVRSLTIREAARIQSFPDDFFFEGSRSAAFKQIGNAVPVLLAEKIANQINLLLKEYHAH